ncbi:hypothetical protein JOC34_000579 [Virgibacillus halotolerans]|uniref:hypothetical protein n=1 Tax=Virgibacillus halotolerans TaxID=1071053 RepID=UPI001961D580|nr:hypothetical protein [Virgibacillus halotolerans]MBM7598222.1 hypothetical protein [Virgibacillus halotolerans]
MKYKVGDVVMIKDINLKGSITDVYERRSISILGDTKTVKYRVQCKGQPLMLFREDQLYKESEEVREIDKDADVPLKLELELLDTLIEGSLVRKNKKEFEEYMEMKREKQERYDSMS